MSKEDIGVIVSPLTPSAFLALPEQEQKEDASVLITKEKTEEACETHKHLSTAGVLAAL